MTLSITQEVKAPIGGVLKIVIYRIVDSDGSGGTVDVPLSHIAFADAVDLGTGSKVTTAWTNDSETITLGTAGAGNMVRLMVLGWGS